MEIGVSMLFGKEALWCHRMMDSPSDIQYMTPVHVELILSAEDKLQTLKYKGASRCQIEDALLPKWFHKKTLIFKEPFCFTKHE